MRIPRYSTVKLDDNLEVNLKMLSPLQQVITSIRARRYTSEKAKMQRQIEADAEYRERAERFELLRDNISNFCIQELLTKKYPDRLEYVDATISRQFEDVFKDVIKSKDLSKFNVKRFEEDKDMLKAFPNLPIKVRISLKEI